ncbi:peptidoglycan-binding protein [Streptomyces sp. M2CJ-2]|uniref:peptidoglycan-binding protein n=1 Tax=Streptomyces sp. M2CJ-2 TaxID=2803948 RepID=UPI00192584AD|nr:peptidoglycan-binding protein [Streptomyces sp. M2CJ-2]MBL3671068.1 peptidoglycan-binding protein [Streptomyces sp. M2CJ-2]
MAHEPKGRDRERRPGERRPEERRPGVQLAWLLRRWWEEAGNAPGGTRPTQQALASKVGIDQTTLSRYLNPKHTSTAPPRVVETLHTHLRAPAAELERARELCRAALEETSRQRVAGHGPEPTGGTGTAYGGAPADGTDGPGAPNRRRSRWTALTLVATAVVLAFVAGTVVRDQYAPGPRTPADGAAAGAAPASGAPAEEALQWPLLLKEEGDQFARGRALQHLLREEEYEVKADGFFTDETQEAVMDFQRRRHLSPDGKVGKHTWPQLVRELGPGDEGHAVLALQELLNNTGQGGTEVSGRFTAATADDLRFFQRSHGLVPSGRSDVQTWLSLLVFQSPPVHAPDYQRSTSPLPSAPA